MCGASGLGVGSQKQQPAEGHQVGRAREEQPLRYPRAGCAGSGHVGELAEMRMLSQPCSEM